ncbi:TetR/AcrR family transcriptional regulator [Oricola indica]|uniref:TetR/AcrR family transcriptional regulator n=1 Tax=Oricola indica TaxID=2872591 RepID=UPI003CCC2F36
MPKPISEVRKPEIVEAAFNAILKNGLPHISYDLIAQEADMSRQLIRHYFPDPIELMVAVCDRLAAAYRDCLMRGILNAQTPQRLKTFLDFYFDFLSDRDLEKPRDDSVYDAMFSLAAAHPKIRENLHAQYNLLQYTIAHEVQVSYPQLNQKACLELGYLFISLMYGHWKMVATLGFSTSNNKVTRAAVDRLIESYVARYDDPDLEPVDESEIGTDDAGK